jgi:hypothetical protein
MLIMAIIYIAGIVSGVLLVAIALAGWIRKAGKSIKGGEHYQTPRGNSGAKPSTNTGTTPVARHRSNSRRRPDSTATGVA